MNLLLSTSLEQPNPRNSTPPQLPSPAPPPAFLPRRGQSLCGRSSPRPRPTSSALTAPLLELKNHASAATADPVHSTSWWGRGRLWRSVGSGLNACLAPRCPRFRLPGANRGGSASENAHSARKPILRECLGRASHDSTSHLGRNWSARPQFGGCGGGDGGSGSTGEAEPASYEKTATFPGSDIELPPGTEVRWPAYLLARSASKISPRQG